jgi:GT2 family glycosyltransferase
MLAQGTIIAFVDDDCQPAEDWLLNARPYFSDLTVVGVEGLIHSDHLNDPEWRPVTNVGFEGIGFMTANLMVRSSVFQYLGGFDLQFDHPHFREDTDFGWCMQDVGSVPYAKDVAVFHPAQPCSKERESAVVRAKFFQKDALLFCKHPEKYQSLFMAERHFERTPGFRENLVMGFENASAEMPGWMSSMLTSQARIK